MSDREQNMRSQTIEAGDLGLWQGGGAVPLMGLFPASVLWDDGLRFDVLRGPPQ